MEKQTSTPTRWTRRPDGSNWGDFGADDQRGRLNLLTPEKVLQGLAEVKEGRTFCLSLPLDVPGGNVLNERRKPPVVTPTLRNGQLNLNYVMAQDRPDSTDVMSDDAVMLHTQYSTQWDGLAHFGQLFDGDEDGKAEPLYYNGYRAGVDVFPGGLRNGSFTDVSALGIDNMARSCVQGRAVMIDLRHHLGDGRTLVDFATLEDIIKRDGVVVEPGDMVCLHTGFADVLLGMQGQPDPRILDDSCAVLDARDKKLLDWIADSGVAVIACDNYAVENHAHAPGRKPFACTDAPLHELCLFKLGIHLGELWHLTPLADWLRAKSRSRFLLTAPPLVLRGAMGSPATPVATV